jgi:hypothetical protein
LDPTGRLFFKKNNLVRGSNTPLGGWTSNDFFLQVLLRPTLITLTILNKSPTNQRRLLLLQFFTRNPHPTPPPHLPRPMPHIPRPGPRTPPTSCITPRTPGPAAHPTPFIFDLFEKRSGQVSVKHLFYQTRDRHYTIEVACNLKRVFEWPLTAVLPVRAINTSQGRSRFKNRLSSLMLSLFG